MTANMIKGQHIQAQQSDEVNNGKWVLKSEENEVMYEVKSKWGDKDIIEALTIMKQFELEAFNVGIAHGKKLATETANKIVDAKNSQIKFLEELNAGLAGHLERLAGARSSMTEEEQEAADEEAFNQMLADKEARAKQD